MCNVGPELGSPLGGSVSCRVSSRGVPLQPLTLKRPTIFGNSRVSSSHSADRDIGRLWCPQDRSTEMGAGVPFQTTQYQKRERERGGQRERERGRETATHANKHTKTQRGTSTHLSHLMCFTDILSAGVS